MAENTNIEWTHHTFNPWIGCTKVDAPCDNCYAEALATSRLKVPWGPGAPRRRTAESTWKQPRKWNRQAEKDGRRYRVFCASLADVFDNEVDPAWRADLFQLIRETPHLDWMLLTKRVINVRKMVEAAGGMPDNVWLGISAGTQKTWDRDVPRLKLLKILYEIPVAFISMEPMLEPIDTDAGLDFYHPCPNWEDEDGNIPFMDRSTGARECCSTCDFSGISGELGIDLIIVGGESGPKARHIHPDWVVPIRDACLSTDVAFMFKQWGEWLPVHVDTINKIGVEFRKVGKKEAGRRLHGKTHDGLPVLS